MAEAVGIVLAAGKGTRMKSRLPKAAHRLGGKPLARHAVDLCRAVGIARVLVVAGHGAETVRAAVGDDVEYVGQERQRGTGDAARRATAALPDYEGTVVVLQGDTPLVTPEVLGALLDRHREANAAATLLSAVLPDGGRYGRVVRGPGGAVARVVERRDAPPDVAALREINVGVYAFAAAALRSALARLRPDNRQGEYYLTDVIELLAEAGEPVETVAVADPSVALGVNDRVELAAAEAILRRRVLEALMLAGVTVIDPATTYVEAGVEVGEDTVLHPMTTLAGRTTIGRGCEIGPGAQITDCRLGSRVRVLRSVLTESEVGDETRVGPFSHLRPGCRVGRRCKIGNFVELKNAAVEDRVSIGHLSYLGDASVGEHSNIGAGTITCNYDGKRKHRTQIGREVFIGSHATLVAPVTVGDGAYTAAASPVTEDVPPGSLTIARSRQTVKEGWARRRREGDQ
jgi:bifunctional UDP-N-acetylglucosamine pyrophosphorylase/glucosamine-1-phosphate N-acetyltransferase